MAIVQREYDLRAGELARLIKRHADLPSQDKKFSNVNECRKLRVIPWFLVTDEGTQRRYASEAAEWVVLGLRIRRSSRDASLEHIGMIYSSAIAQWGEGFTTFERLKAQF